MHFEQIKENKSTVYKNNWRENNSLHVFYWSASTQKVAIETVSNGNRSVIDTRVINPFHHEVYTKSHNWVVADLSAINQEIIKLLELTEFKSVKRNNPKTGASDFHFRKKEKTKMVQGHKYTQVYITKSGEKVLSNVRMNYDSYEKFMNKREEKTFAAAIRQLVQDYLVYHEEDEEKYGWLNNLYNQEIS